MSRHAENEISAKALRTPVELKTTGHRNTVKMPVVLLEHFRRTLDVKEHVHQVYNQFHVSLTTSFFSSTMCTKQELVKNASIAIELIQREDNSLWHTHTNDVVSVPLHFILPQLFFSLSSYSIPKSIPRFSNMTDMLTYFSREYHQSYSTPFSFIFFWLQMQHINKFIPRFWCLVTSVANSDNTIQNNHTLYSNPLYRSIFDFVGISKSDSILLFSKSHSVIPQGYNRSICDREGTLRTNPDLYLLGLLYLDYSTRKNIINFETSLVRNGTPNNDVSLYLDSYKLLLTHTNHDNGFHPLLYTSLIKSNYSAKYSTNYTRAFKHAFVIAINQMTYNATSLNELHTRMYDYFDGDDESNITPPEPTSQLRISSAIPHTGGFYMPSIEHMDMPEWTSEVGDGLCFFYALSRALTGTPAYFSVFYGVLIKLILHDERINETQRQEVLSLYMSNKVFANKYMIADIANHFNINIDIYNHENTVSRYGPSNGAIYVAHIGYAYDHYYSITKHIPTNLTSIFYSHGGARFSLTFPYSAYYQAVSCPLINDILLPPPVSLIYTNWDDDGTLDFVDSYPLAHQTDLAKYTSECSSSFKPLSGELNNYFGHKDIHACVYNSLTDDIIFTRVGRLKGSAKENYDDYALHHMMSVNYIHNPSYDISLPDRFIRYFDCLPRVLRTRLFKHDMSSLLIDDLPYYFTNAHQKACYTNAPFIVHLSTVERLSNTVDNITNNIKSAVRHTISDAIYTIPNPHGQSLEIIDPIEYVIEAFREFTNHADAQRYNQRNDPANIRVHVHPTFRPILDREWHTKVAYLPSPPVGSTVYHHLSNAYTSIITAFTVCSRRTAMTVAMKALEEIRSTITDKISELGPMAMKMVKLATAIAVYLLLPVDKVIYTIPVVLALFAPELIEAVMQFGTYLMDFKSKWFKQGIDDIEEEKLSHSLFDSFHVMLSQFAGVCFPKAILIRALGTIKNFGTFIATARSAIAITTMVLSVFVGVGSYCYEKYLIAYTPEHKVIKESLDFMYAHVTKTPDVIKDLESAFIYDTHRLNLIGFNAKYERTGQYIYTVKAANALLLANLKFDTAVVQRLTGSVRKAPPMAIYLFGEPGVGKTTMYDMITKVFWRGQQDKIARFKLTEDEDDRYDGVFPYTRESPQPSDHWHVTSGENYLGDAKHGSYPFAFFDDQIVTTNRQINNVILSTYISILTKNTAFLNAADPTKKGKVKFDSDLVVVTGNTGLTANQASMADMGAVRRRFDIIARMYKEDGVRRVAVGHYANPDQIDDFTELADMSMNEFLYYTYMINLFREKLIAVPKFYVNERPTVPIADPTRILDLYYAIHNEHLARTPSHEMGLIPDDEILEYVDKFVNDLFIPTALAAPDVGDFHAPEPSAVPTFAQIYTQFCVAPEKIVESLEQAKFDISTFFSELSYNTMIMVGSGLTLSIAGIYIIKTLIKTGDISDKTTNDILNIYDQDEYQEQYDQFDAKNKTERDAAEAAGPHDTEDSWLRTKAAFNVANKSQKPNTGSNYQKKREQNNRSRAKHETIISTFKPGNYQKHRPQMAIEDEPGFTEIDESVYNTVRRSEAIFLIDTHNGLQIEAFGLKLNPNTFVIPRHYDTVLALASKVVLSLHRTDGSWYDADITKKFTLHICPKFVNATNKSSHPVHIAIIKTYLPDCPGGSITSAIIERESDIFSINLKHPWVRYDNYMDTLEHMVPPVFDDTFGNSLRFFHPGRAGLCGAPYFSTFKSPHGKFIYAMHTHGNIEGSLATLLTMEDINACLASPNILLNNGVLSPSVQRFLPEDVLVVQSTQLPMETQIRKSLTHNIIAPPIKLPPSLRDPQYSLNARPATHNVSVMNEHVLDLCVDFFLDKHPYGRHAPISEDAMYHGDSIIGPVNLDTSIGFTTHPQWKKKVDSYDLVDGIYKASSELKARYEHYEKNLTGPIWTSCLKDETRKREKIDAKSARMFYICPFEHVLFGRKFLGHLVATFQQKCVSSTIAVGVNPFSNDWKRLYESLTYFGEDGRYIAGDKKAFDTSVPYPILNAAFTIIKSYYDPQYSTQIDHIKDAITHGSYLYMGCSLQKVNGNASGGPFTSFINSICNTLMSYYAILNTTPDYITYNPLHYINLHTYGDDDIMSLDVTRLPWFTMLTMQQELAKFGVTYTSAHKNEEITSYMELDRIIFLQRYFRPNGVVVLAPRDIEAISDQFQYYKNPKRIVPSDKDITLSVLTSVIIELTQHPIDVFNSYLSNIKNKLSFLITRFPTFNYNDLHITMYFHIDGSKYFTFDSEQSINVQYMDEISRQHNLYKLSVNDNPEEDS